MDTLNQVETLGVGIGALMSDKISLKKVGSVKINLRALKRKDVNVKINFKISNEK